MSRYGVLAIDREWDRESQARDLHTAAQICTRARGDVALADHLAKIPPIDPDLWAQREEVTHHDIAAWVELVREHLPADLADRFHARLTSSDLVDTALAIRLQRVYVRLGDLHTRTVQAMAAFACKYRELDVIGRTHGQPAEYVSVGRRAGLDALRVSRAALYPYRWGKASGPVGVHARDVEPFDTVPSTQVVPRDLLAEWLGPVIMLSLAIEQAALNFRLAARWPHGYLIESGGTHGSSSMPHKRNPVRAERLCGIAAMIRSNARTVQDSSVLWEERDMSHSSVEREALRQALSLTAFALLELREIYETVRVDEDAVARLRDLHPWSAEETYEALVTEGGYTRPGAYNLIRTLGFGGELTGKTGSYHSSREPLLWEILESKARPLD